VFSEKREVLLTINEKRVGCLPLKLMDPRGRILGEHKEPKPDITVCADSIFGLRARIEVWFKKLRMKKELA
jgi:hypothetical protein